MLCRNHVCLAAVLWLVGLSSGAMAQAPKTFGQQNKQRQWTCTTRQGTETFRGRLLALKKKYVLFEDDRGQRRSMPLAQLAPRDRKAALIDRVGSGVVVVQTKNVFDEDAALGSGFVIHRDGVILTNYHVIAGAASVTVSFRDHDKVVPAQVHRVDRKHDLALLQIEKLYPGVHVVEIDSKSVPEQGATVWTVGHPQGLHDTVGWGDVNAIRRTGDLPENLRAELEIFGNSRWLQTDAVLASGSSGGPLLNEWGQVIGVNTFIAGPQLGFAIHISHAQQVYSEGKDAPPLELPLPPGDDADPLAWMSREIAPILKAYTTEYEILEREATRLSDQQKILRLSNLCRKYRKQFLDLAKKDPAGWPAVQALAYAGELCDWEDAEDCLGEVCSLALKHHGDTSHMSSIVLAVSKLSNAPAREFCRRVLQSSPHEKVRLYAQIGLTRNLIQWLRAPDTLDLSKLQGCREEIKALMDDLRKHVNTPDSLVSSETASELLLTFSTMLSTTQIGLEAPEIQGVDSQGKAFKLSDYRGKVILLDFFVDWCPHCRRMYPHEREMVEQLKDRPFALLGVNCESERVLDKVVSNGTVTWRSWADGEQGPISQDWQVTGFPTVVLLDHNGVVRWRSSGVPEPEYLSELVEKLLAEAEGK